MLPVTLKAIKNKMWILEATCPACERHFEFSCGFERKQFTTRCPNCAKSHRFHKPGATPPPSYKKPKELTHEQIDKDQEGFLKGIFEGLEDTAQDLIKNMDAEKKKQLEKDIKNLFPQGEVFGMAVEMFLSSKLPDNRAQYWGQKLGKNLDLLCQKYGIDYIFLEYVLEISTLMMMWQIRREVASYAAFKKKVMKTVEKPTGGIEGEAEESIEKKGME